MPALPIGDRRLGAILLQLGFISDTDMQKGNISKTFFEIKNDQLCLHLPLGNEGIQYIFSRD